MRNLFYYIGFRHLKHSPIRTFLTSLGVALGIALYVAIQVINHSTLMSFKESIESISGKASLVVSAGETGFTEDRLAVVEKTPGVKHAVPMVETRALFATPSGTESLTILGVDLLKEQSVRTYKTTNEQLIEDPLVFINQPDSVILTHSFADAHGLKVDGTITISTTVGKRKLTIRGLLNPEGPAKAYGGALAIMDIDGAQYSFGKEKKLDRIDIVAAPELDIDKLAERLRSRLGAGYSVERPENQEKTMTKLVATYQTMLGFFSTLALLVGIFLVSNSVNISVAERRREIGVLRALGATRAGILALFISEAAVMGFIGSIVGVFLGRFLAAQMLDLVTTSLSMQYLTPIKANHIFYTGQDAAVGILVGTVSAVFAALLPAFKSTLIQPLEAMKRTDSMVVNGRARLFRVPFFIGCGLLVYLQLNSALLWGAHSHFLEKISDVAGVVGPALVGPALVASIILATQPLIRRWGRTIPRLAQDNVLQNPKRTSSNVMTLMVGLTLVMIIAGLNISFKDSINGWFNKVLKADLLVSSYGKLASFQVQPIKEEIGKEIEKVPGVKIGPARGAYGSRFIHFQYEGRQLGLKSYDEPDPADHYGLFVTQDRPAEKAGVELFHAPDLTVLVSENFVLHFDKKAGDHISLTTPTGVYDARIVGIVADYSSSEGALYMNRDRFKKMWSDNLVDAFAVSAAPGVSAAQLRTDIDKKFGAEHNLMTISNSEMRDEISQNIDASFSYTQAIEAAALLVAMLSLLNTFLISVMERTRELGMLRAVGMSRKQMMSLILQEALIQGGFGALVASAIGAWIAHLYIVGSLSYELGWIIHFSFPWAALLTTVLTGIGVTLLASAYPAWRAAHTEIREALEYE